MIKYFHKTTLTPMIEFYGTNMDEISEFTKGAFNVSDNTISTSEGIMKVTVGDWVLQDTNGGFYPIKDNVKQKSYIEYDSRYIMDTKRISENIIDLLKCDESFERGYFTKAEIYLNSISDYISINEIAKSIEYILTTDVLTNNHQLKGLLTICRNNSEYYKFLPLLIEFGITLIDNSDLCLFELIVDCFIDEYICDENFKNKILNKIKSENQKQFIQNYIEAYFKI